MQLNKLKGLNEFNAVETGWVVAAYARADCPSGRRNRKVGRAVLSAPIEFRKGDGALRTARPTFPNFQGARSDLLQSTRDRKLADCRLRRRVARRHKR